MAEPSRYNVGGDEGQKVLENKLKISDQKTLEDTETLLLSDTYKHFFELLEKGKIQFDGKLILQIHKYFLETLYTWAGKTRTVEISKDGVLFCASLQIKRSLENFEKILEKNLPSQKDDKKNMSKKLAIIHCELNAIHPFREGNGRTARLFLDLIAASCGCDPIGYEKSSKEDYIKACIAGMHQDYSKMEKIFYKGLSSQSSNP